MVTQINTNLNPNPSDSEVVVKGANFGGDKEYFDISKFKSQLTYGYQRTNHFQMYINTPSGLQTVTPDTLNPINPLSTSTTNSTYSFRDTAQRLLFDIERVIAPGISLATDEVRRYGYGYLDRKPYVTDFEEMNIIVRSDGAGKNYDFFQSWINLIINYGVKKNMNTTNVSGNLALPYEVSYKVDYATTASIVAYNEDSQVALELNLRNCFPVYVGEMTFDWADNNNILRFPVRLTFSDWTQTRNFSYTYKGTTI